MCAAISIPQAQILASDTGLSAEVVFGGNHMPTEGMEVAVAMLMPAMEHLECSR